MSDRSGAIDPRLRRFGNRLRQLREDRGMTMEELAERAQVGVRQIARVEGGRGSPSVLWLLDAADALGIEAAELLRDLPT
jgi:transcriptional regulator with XRE-family HTH domain